MPNQTNGYDLVRLEMQASLKDSHDRIIDKLEYQEKTIEGFENTIRLLNQVLHKVDTRLEVGNEKLDSGILQSQKFYLLALVIIGAISLGIEAIRMLKDWYL